MQWISVTDIFPPNYESVLVTDGEEIQVAHWLNDSKVFGSFMEEYHRISSHDITHWAWLPPLPSPPEAE